MGVFLKIALVGWLLLIIIYAGLRLAGYPKETAEKRLRLIDSVFFYGLLAFVIVAVAVLK